jgi:hypothetical protein
MEESERLLRKASYMREATGPPLSRLEQMVRYGRLLACTGKTDRAAQLLSKVEALGPESYLRTRLLHMSLEGWVLLARGHCEEAAEILGEMGTLARGFPGLLSEPEAASEWLEDATDGNR